jgi:DNA polymerase elongation subunit (family B)
MPSILNWSINDNWNYLVARAKKLGIDVYASSPTNKFFDQNLPMHRFVVDYMKLFEYLDTTIKIKEDLSLDWVTKTALGKGRINYKATLKNLYDNDYLNFIVRGAIDAILIKLINDKFNLIDLVLILTNSAKVSFYDCMSLITMIESVCIKEAKKKNKIILPNKNVKKQHYTGGYNMEPQKDLFENIVLFDCQSMYVSIIMQWNISPDVQCFEDNENCINTFNGLKFKKNEDGIFKSVISDLYDQRTEANKLAIEYKMEIEKLKIIYNNMEVK